MEKVLPDRVYVLYDSRAVHDSDVADVLEMCSSLEEARQESSCYDDYACFSYLECPINKTINKLIDERYEFSSYDTEREDR